MSLICWVTAELPWIYPDDPRLWSVLAAAMDEGAIPIVVARAVSPLLFPFSKALGGLALQYYLPPLPADAPSDLPSRADAIGWPPLRSPPDLARHPVLQQLRGHVKRLHATPRSARVPQGAVDAMRDGVARGFALPHQARSAEVAAWAAGAAAVALLPSRWVSGVATWSQPAIDVERGASLDSAPGATRGAGSQADPARRHVAKMPTNLESPKATTVTRDLVAAEVDRDTWGAVHAKLKREGPTESEESRTAVTSKRRKRASDP